MLTRKTSRFIVGIGLCLVASAISSSAASQPRLVIDALPNGIELSFQPVVGITNQVQSLDSFTSTNWAVLTNVVSTSNQLVTVMDPFLPDLSSRFYRVSLLADANTNPVVLLDNLTGSAGADGLNIDIDQHVAIGFNLAASATGDWSFSIRTDTSGGAGSSADTLSLQLFDNASNSVTMMDEPGATVPLPLGNPFYSAGVYSISGRGALNAGKYWLVARSTTVFDFYTWIDRGIYTESGASLLGVRSDLADGSGWQPVQTSGPTGHPLSLQIQFVPAF